MPCGPQAAAVAAAVGLQLRRVVEGFERRLLHLETTSTEFGVEVEQLVGFGLEEEVVVTDLD